MSVLIKGMEMPKACEWCSFISTFTTESGLGCRCEIGKFEFWDYSKRQENCPLVEIPTPHGRLIDADNISSDAMCSHCVEEYCRNNCECFIENVQTILSNELITPTIIEAEVSE